MTDTATEPKRAEAGAGLPLAEQLLVDNVLQEVWRICYLANSFVFPIYARFAKQHDILRPEFVTLFCLSHYQPLIAQDIVRMTGLPKNTISRGVKRLLDRGLIARGDHPDDRRMSRLSLTSEGRAMLDRLMPTVESRRDRLIGCLTAAERAELDRMLTKMAQFITHRMTDAGEGS